MNWIHPEWLWTTTLLIPLTLVVLLTGWWHRRRIRNAFGPQLFERVLPRSVRIRRTLRDLSALLALLCGALALAEPAFDKAISHQKVKGVDLVIALDLSRSMDAQDLDPSRIERARREILDLLGQITGDRVAVVFFAGDAISRLPLTEDYRAVEWLLEEANTSMFMAQGSNLARAIDVSRELLARDEGKAGKAMVVFSDGETHEPDAALAAADKGKAEGLMIYTVGIGDAKASIPGPNGPLRHKGQVVYTEPDFSTLQEVARRTGGAYVKSVASSSDMRALYAAIRKGVKSVERDSVARETWNSAYQVPLGMGLLFWLGGAWLGEGRRRFGAAAVVLAVGLSSGVAHATPAEADALYRSERLPAAESAFEELTLQDPGNPDLFRRLGAVRYRMEDYTGAAAAFERANALSGGDPESLYNAGNARYRAGQLETALQRYDEAIGLEQHAPSKANREVVAGELQARRAVQPPPPPPPPEPSEGGDDEQESNGEGDPQPDSEGGGGEQDESSQSDGEQQGDQESDGQQGDNEGQENEEQDGSADSEGQQGEQEKQDPKDGEGQGSDSEEQPGEQDSDGVAPDDLDEPGDEGDEGEANAGDPGEGPEETSGNITPAQAARMIDGVEEGQMRVRMVGASSAKPW